MSSVSNHFEPSFVKLSCVINLSCSCKNNIICICNSIARNSTYERHFSSFRFEYVANIDKTDIQTLTTEEIKEPSGGFTSKGLESNQNPIEMYIIVLLLSTILNFENFLPHVLH